MIIEIILVLMIALGLGALILYILSKYTPILSNFSNRSINKVLNNPEVLKSKLEANGDIIDMGEQIKISIIKDSEGKDVLDIKKEPKTEEIDETIEYELDEEEKTIKPFHKHQKKKVKKKKAKEKLLEEDFLEDENLDLNLDIPETSNNENN